MSNKDVQEQRLLRVDIPPNLSAQYEYDNAKEKRKEWKNLSQDR